MEKNNRLLSGFQDFLPKKMLARNALIRSIKDCCECFGFLPQDTPCLEYADLLLDKYGENEKLIYDFLDKGGRHVALRYDLTVPLSRIIQMYGNIINFPYRRYQVGMVWRADKPGKGRYREFMQIDADIVGDDSLLSDIEMILLVFNIMDNLKVKAVVRINCREILNSLVETCGLNSMSGINLLRVVDKFDKIGLNRVKEELKNLDFTPDVITTAEKYLLLKGEDTKILAELQSLVGTGSDFQNGFDRLSSITNMLKKSGGVRAGSFKIDPSIARGLGYYTGLVFETTFVDDPGFGSICSGGRYDNLVKLPSGEFIPAIGISIGLDRLFAAMESKSLLPKVKTTTKVFIVNFEEDSLPEYLQTASDLRGNGISAEVFPKKIKLAKQLKIANNKGIPIVLLIGSDELSLDLVVVKNMEDGSQEVVARDQLVAYLKGVL